MKLLILMACIGIAIAQYEAPSYADGHEAAGYAPEGGSYDGGEAAAYAGHEQGGHGQAYPSGGYEDGAGYGVETEGAVEHGDAYGAGAGQYDAPQGGYEQFEAYA